MALDRDFDASLAVLGKRTRRDLRRFRRLATEELGCVFVPDAEVGFEAFQELARNSHYRVSASTVRWRYGSLSRFPQTFLAGLRDGNGRWLCLAGCRRRGTGVELDWAMNRRGLERYSLGTAFRAFLIEHEGRRGTTSLFLEGGSRHGMLKYFRARQVYTLTIRRGRLRWLEAVGSLLGRLWPANQITATVDRPWRQWAPARAGEPDQPDSTAR